MLGHSSANFRFFCERVHDKMKEVLVLFHRFLGELQTSLKKQMVAAAEGFGAVFI